MINSTWEHTESDNSSMPLYVSVPDGTGPFPALVVIQHLTGVDEFMQGIAQRLAGAGYVAAVPNLYHRDGPDSQDDPRTRSQRLSDRRVSNDIEATVRFLQNHRAVDGKRIGIIGFCMGGRVVYLAAATNPAFKAAVTFYPGNTSRAWGRDIPSPFDRTADMHCPIQGHFGDDDKNPSPEDRQRLSAELTRHNKVHEFYAYADAGHAFMDHTKESFRPGAAVEAWPRTLDFLRRHLGT
jgi:carboxymethylenebutenolidase